MIAPSLLLVEDDENDVVLDKQKGPVSYTHLTLPTNREV